MFALFSLHVLCQAISSLLKDEMDKVAAAAENERRGAMLKKFKRVERRSGGLCNPDLLEQVVRSSDVSSPRQSIPSPSSSSHAPPLPPPHSQSDPKGLTAALAAAAPASNLVLVDVEDDPEATAAAAAAATPWAEDMLCRAVRKRHAAMLRTRGRALAKGLARMLKGVSQELKGVASRLPPWEEEDPQEDEPAPQEEEVSKGRVRKEEVRKGDIACSGGLGGGGGMRGVQSCRADATLEPSQKAPRVWVEAGGGTTSDGHVNRSAMCLAAVCGCCFAYLRISLLYHAPPAASSRPPHSIIVDVCPSSRSVAHVMIRCCHDNAPRPPRSLLYSYCFAPLAGGPEQDTVARQRLRIPDSRQDLIGRQHRVGGHLRGRSRQALLILRTL